MKLHTRIVIALLLGMMLAIPGATAANRTNQSGDWVHSFDQWAGQKDMSRYSNIPDPEPLQTMNESTARLYPNVTWCGKDCMKPKPCTFPYTGCGSPLTIQIVYNVNTTDRRYPGTVVGYGMGGWPLENPIFISGWGRPDIVLPFESLAGMFA